MIIGVTSKNGIKIDAVRSIYENLGYMVEIYGYSTDSKVGEQPINDETELGAMNRIDSMKNVRGLDKIISIESGLFYEDEKWIDKAVVVVYDVKSKEYSIAYSKGVEFPKVYVEVAEFMGFKNITVGELMKRDSYIDNAKDPHSSIGKKIPRQQYIENTLMSILEKECFRHY